MNTKTYPAAAVRVAGPRFPTVLAVAIALGFASAARAQTPLGTGWTYQGQLKLSGSPLNDTVDLQFSLWDAGVAGNQVDSTLIASNLGVVDGLFTTVLDFGSDAFDGDARWLEIAVRSPHDPTDTAPYTTLSPRQALTAAPYALQTRGMFVDTSGNVGVGTLSPVNRLSVIGRADFSENVGIGTSSPIVRLHIVGGGDATPFSGGFLVTGQVAGQNIVIDDNEIMARDGGMVSELLLNKDGGTLTLCKNAGRVGIGTSFPTNKLSVVGDADFSGNVGIGTSSPSSTLSVGGDVDFSGKVGIGTAIPEGILSIENVGNVDGVNLLTFSEDENAEFFFESGFGGAGPTGNSIRLQTFWGANAMTWRGDGNVGIGTTAPATELDVVGTVTATAFIGDGSGLTNLPAANLWALSGSDVFYDAGNVGIGTSLPDVKLHIVGGTDVTPSSGGFLVMGSTFENMSIDGNEIMARSNGAPGTLNLNQDGGIITLCRNSGSVGIGTGSPSEALHVVGNICSTGTIGACSDVRFKKRIDVVPQAVALIKKLRGVRFDWKRDEFAGHGFSDQRQIGFIAQEIRDVLPEVVSRGSDGYYSVDYGRLTPVLVEAIKELDNTLAHREARVVAQDAQLAKLTARLERIEGLLASLTDSKADGN